MNEIWKDVVGYEGTYMVSNQGRIKSIPRTTTKGGLMRTYVNKRNGYCYVCLSKNGIAKQKRVHKLVAQAFLGFREDGFNAELVIDHLDGDKTNNKVENLDICTQKENDRRARLRIKQRTCGVKVINLGTGEVFESYTDAAHSVGGKTGEMVARVCRGERSHYRTHKFAKLDDYENGSIPKFSGRRARKASETLWR